MTTTTFCPKCRHQLPADAPQGLCPICLLRGGLADLGEPDPARAEAVLAKRLPQYKLVGFAGRGGMGEVWVVEHVALGRKAALKLLSPSVSGAPGFAERFLQEARAMADLSHPNVLAVYDFGECDGEFFLVLEYAPSNLRHLMGSYSPRLPLWEVLGAFLPLCDAVAYMHEHQLIHLDLKPENVLRVQDQFGARVKLADFGLARSTVRPNAAIGAVAGTPDYMAPEQWKNPEQVDHRTDVYALGLILYELLTGERPSGNYPPPSERSGAGDRRLDDVVAKALAPAPADRYQTVEELRDDVKAIRDRFLGTVRWTDLGRTLLVAVAAVLGFLAVFLWGRSVASHAFLAGVLWLSRRNWYSRGLRAAALVIGCVAVPVIALAGPLLNLPPLVEPLPLWHPGFWVLTVGEMWGVGLLSGLLFGARIVLDQRLYPQDWPKDQLYPRDWVYRWRVNSPLAGQPPQDAPYRFVRVLTGWLAFGLFAFALLGYWFEPVWPVWRWSPFVFWVLLVPVLWPTWRNRPSRPVAPFVETCPVGAVRAAV